MRSTNKFSIVLHDGDAERGEVVVLERVAWLACAKLADHLVDEALGRHMEAAVGVEDERGEADSALVCDGEILRALVVGRVLHVT